jgi:YD repeat-containing protein
MKHKRKITFAFFLFFIFLNLSWGFDNYYREEVNPKNLNFYYPNTDLYLTCFGFPLEVSRAYNSVSSFNGLFGYAWTFNYDIRITEKQGYIEILESDGYRNEYIPSEFQDKYKSELVKKIIEKIKLEHKKIGETKSTEYYKTLSSKLSNDPHYYNEMKEKYLLNQIQLKEGNYVSETRGKTILQKFKEGYLRKFQTGTQEFFSKRGRLVKMVDIDDNAISFKYNKGLLHEVTDPCGRTLIFSYNDKEKITKIADSFNRTLEYKYDKNGMLIEAKDLNGKITKYFYSGKYKQLNKITYPDGKTTTLRYNDKGQVYETRKSKNLITKYEPKIDPNNKNHYYRIVTDNTGYWKRYDYYDDEYKTIETEKTQKKTITTLTPCCGKPLNVMDEKGRGIIFQYNEKSNLKRKIDQDGTITEYTYETIFEKINEIKISNGDKIKYTYDAKSHLTSLSNSNGKFLKLTYMKRGKIDTIIDNDKNEINFVYNDFGKTTIIAKKNIGQVKAKYDDFGTATETVTIIDKNFKPKDVTDPEKIKELALRDIKATLFNMLNLLKPSGASMEF